MKFKVENTWRLMLQSMAGGSIEEGDLLELQSTKLIQTKDSQTHTYDVDPYWDQQVTPWIRICAFTVYFDHPHQCVGVELTPVLPLPWLKTHCVLVFGPEIDLGGSANPPRAMTHNGVIHGRN